MSKILSAEIPLPENYRHSDFLAFHKRDQLMVAENVCNNILKKGIVWQGNPALLKVTLENTHANIELLIDDVNSISEQCRKEFDLLTTRLFGLQQNITEFEQKYRKHKILGSLISQNAGLRVAVTATPFEALTWAITGQQISVHAAISIRRKFIQLCGVQHSSGLWCYPDEHILANLNEEKLRLAGFSLAKANTLMTLNRFLLQNSISLNNMALHKETLENLSAQLLAIRGIGPWSINYALLRGFGWLDGSLHGDVAVRRNLQILLGASEKIPEKETQQWLLKFSPWRALVAAHLWTIK